MSSVCDVHFPSETLQALPTLSVSPQRSSVDGCTHTTLIRGHGTRVGDYLMPTLLLWRDMSLLSRQPTAPRWQKTGRPRERFTFPLLAFSGPTRLESRRDRSQWISSEILDQGRQWKIYGNSLLFWAA